MSQKCLGRGFAIVFLLVGASLFAADATTVNSSSLDTERFEVIDALVEEAIEEGKLPGAVVTIGYRDQVVFERAYGHRQRQPTPLPMTLDTVFDLASLTKPIATATSVMILVDRGEIAIDDPVSKHLPEFANRSKESITIKQLLLHTSGLIPDNAMADYAESAEKAIENVMSLGLNYTPDQRFRYSDVGFIVLAELIQRKTGQDVHAFSQENIFIPLGMQETGFLPDVSRRDRFATTQRRQGRWMRGEVHDPRAYALGGIAGHAGLFSTAADLSRYANAMTNHGRSGETTVLSRQAFDAMTASYAVPGDGIRGLGWDKRTGYSSNRGKTMTSSAFGHGGFTGTALWIDPELELYVIFLSNRVHPDGKGSVNALAGKIGTIAADAAIAASRASSAP